MNWVSIPAALMAAVSCYVGFSYLWMFMRRRTEKENLAFAATCLSIALYDTFCAGLYSAPSPATGMFWQRCQFAALAMFIISMSWFLYYFVKYGRRIPFIVITAVHLVFLILGLSVWSELTLEASRPFPRIVTVFGSAVTYNEVRPGVIYTLQFVSMILTAVYLQYVLARNFISDDRHYAMPIGISMALFFAASVNDVLVGAGIYPFIYLMEYAYLFIMLSMAHVLQNRFFDLNREVEELTHQLEEKVNNRTLELFLSEITHRLYADIAGEYGPDAPGGDDHNGKRPDPAGNLSQDISIILNIDKLLKRTLEKGAEIISVKQAYLFMADEGGHLGFAAGIGEGGPDDWISSAAHSVFSERRHFIKNGSDDSGNQTGDGVAANTGLHSLLVPVMLRDNAVGVCCFHRPANQREFTERDTRIVGAYIAQAVSAIENAYLYQRMIDRHAAMRQHSVTPSIEEKMKKAIAYIDENYRSDISREGLAASLNMHPDSFGRFFKVYTSRRISDYVNELRVRDAAENLRQTDKNIIDIAFAAGFESLPTFNRAFRKVMRVTPTRYREQNHLRD